VTSKRDDQRPDPDLLLKKLFEEEARERRGHLRIYLGAAPGVGKSYAMLQEGQRRKRRGTDVVVGYVETHNRPLTLEAAQGLEVVPRRKVLYQGVEIEEMDTDAVVARRPKVALIDELAHTNAPGSKHERRYEDVQEIIAAGINVISTLNIQHLQSLNDVVAGITGIRVRETVPDSVVDNADEVEVVDMSPEALRARMRHGNIYPPDQATRALAGFFRPGNLAALRELALRRVLGEVDQQLSEYMTVHGLEGWEAGERVCVLLDHTPVSEVAVRRAWRLAHAFTGELFAAYLSSETKEQGMTHILTVALDLNATLKELPGEDLEAELDAFLREEHIGHLTLIIDAPKRFSMRFRASLAERLLLRQPHLAVHLVAAHSAMA
jgi:two-component system, OmpR family, sensor histidine kinase KdpD